MPSLHGLLSVLATLVLLLTACASPEERHARPALWKISDGKGHHGYVFGSVHSLPDGIDWRTSTVSEAVAESGQLVLEIDDVADSSALAQVFQTMGRTPGLPPLERRLPRDRWEDAKRLAKEAELSPAAIAQTESWALALILASQSTNATGASSQNGVDVTLQELFEESDKPIFGLETVQEQFAAFDSLGEVEQRLMLDAAVAGATTAQHDFAELVRAWSKGNLKQLAAISRDKMLVDNPAIRDNLLVRRNRNWARKITPLLASGHIPFISVGAGHLVGQDNLLFLLETGGIEVKRVQ